MARSTPVGKLSVGTAQGIRGDVLPGAATACSPVMMLGLRPIGGRLASRSHTVTASVTAVIDYPSFSRPLSSYLASARSVAKRLWKCGCLQSNAWIRIVGRAPTRLHLLSCRGS